MNLIFDIPKFYITRYGDEPEINLFCENICEIAKNKEYSTKVNQIDLIPWILPEELLSEGFGEEITKIELKYKLVTLARQIDFNDYQKASIVEKKGILMKFIVNTLSEVQKKIGFDLETFKQDISHLL